MLKEKIKRRKWRANIMKDLVKHKKYKEDEKLRKWAAKKTKQANAQMTTPQPIGENYSAANNSTPNSGSSFSCKQTLYHSITRADLHLSKNRNKKAIQSYPKTSGKIQIKNKLERKSRKAS